MSEQNTMNARQVAEELLRRAADPARSDSNDLYAPDVVIELPFTAKDVPVKLEGGREALRADEGRHGEDNQCRHGKYPHPQQRTLKS